MSPAIAKTKEMAKRIASIDCSVLLVGESGTGKELFAHSIHNASMRINAPFVCVNCPSIPFDLAESELFGYEKGLSQGPAKTGRKGSSSLPQGVRYFWTRSAQCP